MCRHFGCHRWDCGDLGGEAEARGAISRALSVIVFPPLAPGLQWNEQQQLVQSTRLALFRRLELQLHLPPAAATLHEGGEIQEHGAFACSSPSRCNSSQWAFVEAVLCFVFCSIGIDGRWADVLPLCLGDTSPESPGGSVIPSLWPSSCSSHSCCRTSCFMS